MLVLSRKINQTIIINDTVKITIVGIKGGQVRIGIDAPPEVTVDRAEIHVRRQAVATVGESFAFSE